MSSPTLYVDQKENCFFDLSERSKIYGQILGRQLSDQLYEVISFCAWLDGTFIFTKFEELSAHSTKNLLLLS